jgi:hypothetical protein
VRVLHGNHARPSALAHWLKEAPQETDQRTPTLCLSLCLGAAAPVRLHSLRIGIQHPSSTLLSNGLQVGVGLNDSPAVALCVDGTSVGKGSCQNFMRSASVCGCCEGPQAASDTGVATRKIRSDSRDSMPISSSQSAYDAGAS